MLASFSVKNYRSIIDLKADLSYAEGKAPNSYHASPNHIFFQKKTCRIIPCLAILGANASGKTNFVKALHNLQQLLKKNIESSYDPNLIHNSSRPTTYNICFYVGEDYYTYNISFNAQQIVAESLAVNEVTYFSIEEGVIRTYKSSWESYSIDKLNEILKVEGSVNGENIYLQNKSFMGLIYNNYPGLDNIINRTSKYIDSLLVYFSGSFPNISTLINYANKNSKLYNENRLLGETAKVLKQFDFDIEAITYKERTFKSQDEFIAFLMDNPLRVQEGCNFEERKFREHYAIHKNMAGDSVEFKLSEESSGTQILIQLIMVILISLESGTPLIIDEMDRAIHPFILNCILNIYKDKEYNTQNSQLIFTTHTTDILENSNIRISEIGLVDKTKGEGTILKRASDFKGVRNIHNFRKLYCSGQLTAVPFPYI